MDFTKILTKDIGPAEYPGPRFRDGEHPLSAKKDAMWEKFVPAMGSTKSVEAELFLAANRLGHDYYNNGMCNNVNYAMDFIKEHSWLKQDPLLSLACNIINAYLYDESDFRDQVREYYDDGDDDDEPLPPCDEVDFNNREADWALDYLVEKFLLKLEWAHDFGALTPLTSGLFDK